MFSTFTTALLSIHILLYLLWKLPAKNEKRTRQRGEQIPTYVSGDWGDWLGFTLVVYAFSLTPLTEGKSVVAAFLVAVLVTVALHLYWKRSARRHIISLYNERGPTLSGRLHLVYVLFIAFLSASFLFTISAQSVESIFWFSLGFVIYGITVMVDAVRGVI